MTLTATKPAGRLTHGPKRKPATPGPLDLELDDYIEQRTGQRPIASAAADADEQEIPLPQIADSPYQLRQTHDEDLEGLRDTLVSHGLLQAVVVRPMQTFNKAGRGHRTYELLAGHRRCAAARLAGWQTIRARVQEATNEHAREIVVIENLLRKDLSAIEEARGLQAMLAGGHYATQEAVAQRLGVTQGHVANRLSYLKLPAVWQDAIITGEIPHTYARAILPYCEDPRAAAAIAKVRPDIAPSKSEQKKAAAGKGLVPVSYETLRDKLYWAFVKSGLPVDEWHSERDAKSGNYVSLPRSLSEEQRQRLDIVRVKAGRGTGRQEAAVAMNRAAWFDIAREHYQREQERYGRVNRKLAGKPAGKMSDADRKRARDEERARKAKVAEQLRRRRKSLIVDRLRHLVALRVLDAATTETELLELTTQAHVESWLDGVTGWTSDGVRSAAGREATTRSRAARLIAECMWDSAGKAPRQIVPESQVQRAAEFLAIDGAAAWRVDQLGRLTTLYWNAHSKSDLIDQARKAGMQIKGEPKKGQVVAFLAAAKVPPPAGLSPAKKRAPKPR